MGLGETFKKELFGKEVEDWLARATPAERERFDKVFESIRSIAESKKAPEAHTQFIHSTMEKLKQRGYSAAAAGGRTTPVEARAPSAAGGAGWSYTTTRAASGRAGPLASTRTQQQTPVQQHPQHQRSPAPDAEVDRPQSAPNEAASGGEQGAQAPALAQAAGRRRAISMGHAAASGLSSPEPTSAAAAAAAARTAGVPSPSGRNGGGGGGGGGGGTGFVPISPHVTNYHESYTLRSAYPEVYDKAVQDTKIDVEPNRTFLSDWGDSLKVGADEAAKLYMRTTYNTLNDEVVKLRTDAEAIREREFFKWMQRQKTFYGDLLSKATAADLEQLMAVADEGQRRELLETLRGLHAVADPCFDRTRSHSQAVHCEMRRMEDGKPQSRLQLNTKLRIMGALEAVAQRRGSLPRARPATALPVVNLNMELEDGAGEAGAAAAAAGDKALKPSSRRPATAGTVLTARRSTSVPRPQHQQRWGEKRDMFRAKAPLTWPSGQSGPNLSTYVEAFGGTKIGAGHARPDSALWRVEPIRPVDASVPYGAVNPHTAAAPARGAYPVPEGFLAGAPGTAAAFPLPQGVTTYRGDFPHRDPADLTAQLRAAAALAENGRKTLERSTIPLTGRTGVDLIPSAQWASEARASYVAHSVDHREPFQRAAAMRAMMGGPTASTGKVTESRP